MCECGCGRVTNLASRGYRRPDGTTIKRGEHYRFLANHHNIGRYRPSRADLQPTRKPDDRAIAWAAGFWEGEGSVVRHRNAPQVSAVQKEVWCLEQLRLYFGGSITTPRDNGCSHWHAHGELARKFLTLIWPFLSPRRKVQVQKAWPEVMTDDFAY